MVKETKLELVSYPYSTVTTTKATPKGSKILSSIIISIAIIASISVIGITTAYMLSHSTDIGGGKCLKDVLVFEQKGYYPNLEEYKAASASCIK